MRISLKTKFYCLLLLFSIPVVAVNAQELSPDSIDRLVTRTLKTFDVPGIAVGIVKYGKLIFARGYGVASLNTGKKVDENTLFGIASNSKAFTTAAIGILADEGKLKLDDKVTDYIPEFKMYDPYMTAEFTIRDLLTHRSGLGLGIGDLVDFPDSTDFTMADVIHNFRYFKPVTGFRSAYAYDNQLYKVAGEVIARVSGMSWEQFIETHIMKPLQMNSSAAAYQRIKDYSNVVDAHGVVEGKVKVLSRYLTTTGDAAGGIYSSVNDLSKWLIMQINNGSYGDGKQLFSKAIHHEMWTVQTPIPVGGPGRYNVHFAGYGLGWFLNDCKGYMEASHTGGITGMVTKIDLLPELKLGIIVLTDQENGAAFSAIDNQIKDAYLEIKGNDWVKIYDDLDKKNHAGADKVTDDVWKEVALREKSRQKENLGQFAGTFHDNWLGDVTIKYEDGKLYFLAKRSPKLIGRMYPYKGNTFAVKWNDRSLNGDAFATFSLDEDGKPSGITMKPISPLTDFSYDFQDLDFHKVK